MPLDASFDEEEDVCKKYLLDEPAPKRVPAPEPPKKTNFIYNPIALTNYAVVDFLRAVILYLRQRDRIFSSTQTTRERDVYLITPVSDVERQATLLMSAVHFRIKNVLCYKEKVDAAEFELLRIDVERLADEVATAMIASRKRK